MLKPFFIALGFLFYSQVAFSWCAVNPMHLKSYNNSPIVDINIDQFEKLPTYSEVAATSYLVQGISAHLECDSKEYRLLVEGDAVSRGTVGGNIFLPPPYRGVTQVYRSNVPEIGYYFLARVRAFNTNFVTEAMHWFRINENYIKIADTQSGPEGFRVVFVKLRGFFKKYGSEDKTVNLNLSFGLQSNTGPKAMAPINAVYTFRFRGNTCNIRVPAEFDLGDITTEDLKNDRSVSKTLTLESTCTLPPDNADVVFSGNSTSPGILDTVAANNMPVDNLKFRLLDKSSQPLQFNHTYNLATLSRQGNLASNNHIDLNVSPIVQDKTHKIPLGRVSGNLTMEITYR